MARDGGQPGVPHTNGIIERTNQLIIGGTGTCLIAAGLPPCYWTYASPCFCVHYNTTQLCGISPWEKTHGSPFEGERFPFGCLVMFKPTESRGIRQQGLKWSPKARWGVFAGYKLVAGYKWRGEYYVWELMDFKNADLLITTTKHKQSHVGSPHTTKVVCRPEGDLKFPLKADYDRVNTSLFDQSVVNCDENAISMVHPFVGPGRGLSVIPQEDAILAPQFEELEAIGYKDDEVPATTDAETVEQIAARKAEEEDIAFNRQTFESVREGKASDGIVYVNKHGKKVRLDKNGSEFGCDLDGVRNTMRSKRPEGMEPEVWNMIVEDRKKNARLAERTRKKALKEASKPIKARAKVEPVAPPLLVKTTPVDEDVAPELSASAVILLSDILDNISESESVHAMPAVPGDSDNARVDSCEDEAVPDAPLDPSRWNTCVEHLHEELHER